MQTAAQTLTEIEEVGVVAVIRFDQPQNLLKVCRSLTDGGVTACELTMTTPGALAAISQVRKELGQLVLVGAGSVLDAAAARAAIAAGAQFVVAPTFNRRVVATAQQHDRVAIPGAFTPGEIHAAWTAGAGLVKVFPACLLGPSYLRDLRGPLPDIRTMVTGGVSLESIPDWIRAGAAVVGVGASLVDQDLVAAGDWDGLAALARQVVDAVHMARQMGPT